VITGRERENAPLQLQQRRRHVCGLQCGDGEQAGGLCRERGQAEHVRSAVRREQQQEQARRRLDGQSAAEQRGGEVEAQAGVRRLRGEQGALTQFEDSA
jgi:hypothetical protein